MGVEPLREQPDSKGTRPQLPCTILHKYVELSRATVARLLFILSQKLNLNRDLIQGGYHSIALSN